MKGMGGMSSMMKGYGGGKGLKKMGRGGKKSRKIGGVKTLFTDRVMAGKGR